MPTELLSKLLGITPLNKLRFLYSHYLAVSSLLLVAQHSPSSIDDFEKELLIELQKVYDQHGIKRL